MTKKILALYCLTFLVSCNCQKTINKDKNNESIAISSEKIKEFLVEKNFFILEEAQIVVAFDIKKSLIEGTVDEYSNKLFLKDTLEHHKADKLLELIKDDASYDWSNTVVRIEFNLARQFLIKNNTQRIFLLINTEGDEGSFIGLEGRSRAIRLTPQFSNFLEKL